MDFDAIDFAFGAEVGYWEAQDERELMNQAEEPGIDERELRERLIKDRQGPMKKVPLASRHEERGKPFERWLQRYLRGEVGLNSKITYTREELIQFGKEQM